jgi:uncharacterized OB-fold protein
VSEPQRQLPSPDRDSAPYWAALAEGRLELQRCRDCATWRWPARAICARCHSFDASWEVTDGCGRIASWVVTHQAFAPGWQDCLPSLVVSVALDVAPEIQLIGNLVSGEPSAGRPVRATFPAVGEGVRLLQWEVCSEAQASSRNPDE